MVRLCKSFSVTFYKFYANCRNNLDNRDHSKKLNWTAERLVFNWKLKTNFRAMRKVMNEMEYKNMYYKLMVWQFKMVCVYYHSTASSKFSMERIQATCCFDISLRCLRYFDTILSYITAEDKKTEWIVELKSISMIVKRCWINICYVFNFLSFNRIIHTKT